MNTFFKQCYFLFAGALARALPHAPRAYVLMYHMVTEDKDFFAVTPAQLRTQLETISHCADIVPLADIVALAKGKRFKRDIVALTFDDGYRDFIENALPILHEYGAPATLFVAGGHVDRAALGNEYPLVDASDRAVLSDPLVTLGSHAITHRKLPRLTPEELTHELTGSKTYIEETYGTQVHYLAYPKGSWNSAVAAEAERAGYTAAFTVGNRSIRGVEGLFGFPRIQVDSTTSHIEFKAKLTPAIDWYTAMWSLQHRVLR